MSQQILRISVMGPQGSGKGTQSELLSSKLGIPVFSMGQLLRDEAKNNTDTSREIQEILNKGMLINDDITNKLFEQRITKEDAQKGFISDGYPRREKQYNFVEAHGSFTHVLLINLSDEEAIDRIAGRRVCSCKEIYHITYNPPKNNETCDTCGAALVVRDDDQPEAVKQRLEIYHKETKWVVDQYTAQGKIFEINGGQSIENVHKEIMKIFS